MNGFIPDEEIRLVREQFDILDVVSKYVHLKKRGRYYFGLCPFHSEKTPSFSVDGEKQIFHCFGCGVGGDVFSFLMAIENVTFGEAVRELADRAGIVLSDAHDTGASTEAVKRKNRMYEALELAAKFYRHVLEKTAYGQRARDYLDERQLTPDAQKAFCLGFAPDSWDTLLTFLKRRQYDEKLLEEIGLVTARTSGTGYYDRFRKRIMFPIEDTQGRVIGFGGRIVGDGTPKYLNSPETPLFNKSRFLYNFHRARQTMRVTRQAVLFEGYVDVITAWQAGVKNGVASLGTALTEEQARLLSRNVDTVIICYDSDAAGETATLRSLDLLKAQGCIVKVAQMPVGMDPDDYIRKYGGDVFIRDILSSAVSLTAFKLQMVQKGVDLNDEDEKLKMVKQSLEIITDLPEALERDHYMRQLSEQFNLSYDAVKTEQRKLYYDRKKREKRTDKAGSEWNNSKISKHMLAEQPLQPAHYRAERKLIAFMMRDRRIAERIQQEIGSAFNVDEFAALAAYIYAYYAEGHTADAGRFVHYLPDESLKKVASALAMEDVEQEVTPNVIDDYIRQVKVFPLEQALEEKRRQVRLAEQTGNWTEAVKIAQDLIHLQKQVKLRKEGM